MILMMESKELNPRLFFKFYAKLFKNLSKPVDLVDLSEKSSTQIRGGCYGLNIFRVVIV